MEIFENAGLLSTCRRTKTEVFEYYDVINCILLTLRTFVRNAFVFTLFSVFAGAGENDSNTLRVDAYSFRNGGQNSPFSKIRVDKADTCGQGRYVWTRPIRVDKA